MPMSPGVTQAPQILLRERLSNIPTLIHHLNIAETGTRALLGVIKRVLSAIFAAIRSGKRLQASKTSQPSFFCHRRLRDGLIWMIRGVIVSGYIQRPKTKLRSTGRRIRPPKLGRQVPPELKAPITVDIERQLEALVDKFGEEKVRGALDPLVTKCKWND